MQKTVIPAFVKISIQQEQLASSSPWGRKKNVFLNIPGRSVISSSSQVTSESYKGASKGFNHIAQQMLWNYYSESLPRTSTAPWFSWNSLWPTLSLHQLHYDCINPKDALISPLLQFLWILTPRHPTHVPHVSPPYTCTMLFHMLSKAGLFSEMC